MVRINYTDDLQKFALTLSELSSIPAPNFLFVFTNDMTKEVKKVVLFDLSLVPSRYNLFEIAGTWFPASGWYSYAVYEQVSAINTDEAGLNIVERGRFYVITDSPLLYTENETQVNFKEYAG